jgi:hypothetical protein
MKPLLPAFNAGGKAAAIPVISTVKLSSCGTSKHFTFLLVHITVLWEIVARSLIGRII